MFRYALATMLLFISLAAPARGGTFRAANEHGAPDIWLVVLADGVARRGNDHSSALPPVANVARELARAHDGEVTESWSHALRGFVVTMPEARARKLAEDPRVLSVEQAIDADFLLAAPVGDCYRGIEYPNARPLPSPSASPQVLDCEQPDSLADTGGATTEPVCRDNWGIDRVDQQTGRNERFGFVNNGTGVHVYVLDSGIRRDHVEFKDANNQSRVLAGIDARFGIDPDNGTNTNDCYGHGTHVAAIIAGRTYGIAKNALLHPIRIVGPDPYKTTASPGCPLDGSGDRTSIKVVRALDWITANAQRPAVVNWSGGNDYTLMSSSAIGTAVQGVLSAGIHFVQAAGNQTGAYNPDSSADACNLSLGGRYPGVIVAGGMDHKDRRWVRTDHPEEAEYLRLGDYGSNAGSCIDIWAPAEYIISASYDRDETVATNLACRLSGTSMAAPHVTGAVAIYLQSNPSATPAEVERALRSRGSWNRLLTGDTNANSIGRASDNVVLFSDTRSPASDLPPVASFNVSCPGLQCIFDATTSTDDKGITSYTWDLGGGVTATGSVVRHTYTYPDTVRVTLRVADAGDRTDHLMQGVRPGSDTPPTASFPQPVCSGRTCSVDASGSTDNVGIASYHWSWGDGTSTASSAPTATHSYAGTATSFTITLTATDNLGQTGTATRTVTVAAPPVPRVTSFCEGKTCRFDGSTSTATNATVVRYRFEYLYPDAAGTWISAGTTELTSPVHDYPAFPHERFQVRLSVQDSNGLWSGAPAIRYGVAKAVTEVPLVFYATEPCSLGSTTIAMDQPKLVQAKNTPCVPNDAAITAIAAVVRLSNAAAYPGYLRIDDDPATSILNLATGRTEHSNFAVLPTDAAGKVELILKQFGSPAPTTATLTVDVVGYFHRAGSAPPTRSGSTVGPLWLQPLTPCLLFDTRTEGPGISSSGPRLFDLRSRCGVTGTDSAIVLQSAIVNPATDGRAVAYAAASSAPASAASIDATAGRNVSSAIVSKLSSGSLRVATTIGSADATLATTGVFRGTAGQSFFMTPPCRLLDTRQNVNGKSRLAHNVPLSFQVRGQCGIPSHASAALLYVTAVQADGTGHVRVYPTGGTEALYAAVNFKPWESIGSTTLVPLGSTLDDVTARMALAGSGGHLVVDVYGYFSGRNNVARSATVNVSSSYDATRFPPATIVDGDRRGTGWGSGTGGWSDGTRDQWGDSVGLALPAAKWIEEIDIFTLQDDYASGTDPYEGLAFTEDGIQDFTVFYHHAATDTWVPIADIKNNDQVWRRIVLREPVHTSNIWISITRSLMHYSRVVEVELWEAD